MLRGLRFVPVGSTSQNGLLVTSSLSLDMLFLMTLAVVDVGLVARLLYDVGLLTTVVATSVAVVVEMINVEVLEGSRPIGRNKSRSSS